MGNINNQTYRALDFQLSNNGYWDMYLAADSLSSGGDINPVLTGECFVVWYDFNNPETFGTGGTEDTIYSLVSWTGATNTGYTLNTVGLTGLDNGLVTYERDVLDPTNAALVSALTESVLIVPSGDTRLTLHAVTGFSGNYSYPMELIYAPDTGNYMQLCGGFYQGFYKLDGTDYEVLPNRVNQAWVSELWLNPQVDYCDTSVITLNDAYPDNYGFFLYFGTRAENKYWDQFFGNNTGCTSACTVPDTACTDTVTAFCTVPKESDITIIDENGFGIPLIPPQVKVDLITNQFLIYGRARDVSSERLTGETGTIILSAITNATSGDTGCHFNYGSYDGLGTKTVYTYDGEGIAVARISERNASDTNPFLIYGRSAGYNTGATCGCSAADDSGYGTQTTSEYNRYEPITQLDYNLDIIDNALGFRIKPDGSIGYRLMTVTGSCVTNDVGERIYQSGVTIQEEYSASGMVKTDEWSYVVVKFVTNYEEICDDLIPKQRTGKLMFYVNARLKFVVNDFPEFIARRLDEHRLKQVGVPFNISLGGGTQGLADSMTFDGPDDSDIALPLEQNFGGSFIGYISQFKFNICNLSFNDIYRNYLLDANRYNIVGADFMLTEEGFYLVQENGDAIIL
jgi:hypothetical protein